MVVTRDGGNVAPAQARSRKHAWRETHPVADSGAVAGRRALPTLREGRRHRALEHKADHAPLEGNARDDALDGW